MIPGEIIPAPGEILSNAGRPTVVVDVRAITALQRAVSPDVVARIFGVFFALVLAAMSLAVVIFGISAEPE